MSDCKLAVTFLSYLMTGFSEQGTVQKKAGPKHDVVASQ